MEDKLFGQLDRRILTIRPFITIWRRSQYPRVRSHADMLPGAKRVGGPLISLLANIRWGVYGRVTLFTGANGRNMSLAE